MNLKIMSAEVNDFVVVYNFAEESFSKFCAVFELFLRRLLEVQNSCVFLKIHLLLADLVGALHQLPLVFFLPLDEHQHCIFFLVRRLPNTYISSA